MVVMGGGRDVVVAWGVGSWAIATIVGEGSWRVRGISWEAEKGGGGRGVSECGSWGGGVVREKFLE